MFKSSVITSSLAAALAMIGALVIAPNAASAALNCGPNSAATQAEMARPACRSAILFYRAVKPTMN